MTYVFPTMATGLSQGESPSLYKPAYIDNSNKAKTDGGYEFRRRKFTRPMLRTYMTGFLNIPHADYLILKAFFETVQFDTEFTWHDTLHSADRTVRFDEFTPEYVGVGQSRIWNVKIKLSEI